MAFVIENGVVVKHIEEAGCREAVIPDGITGISADAFIYSQNVESVSIPDSIVTIPSGVFWSCGKLKYIKLYKGDISVTVELNRIYYFGQLISFICAPSLSEKEEAFLRMKKGDLCLPTAVFLVLAYDSESGRKFLKRNISSVVMYLIDTQDIAALTAVIEMGAMTCEQLSQAVDHAISRGELEIQVALSRYKNKHFAAAPLDDLIL